MINPKLWDQYTFFGVIYTVCEVDGEYNLMDDTGSYFFSKSHSLKKMTELMIDLNKICEGIRPDSQLKLVKKGDT